MTDKSWMNKLMSRVSPRAEGQQQQIKSWDVETSPIFAIKPPDGRKEATNFCYISGLRLVKKKKPLIKRLLDKCPWSVPNTMLIISFLQVSAFN